MINLNAHPYDKIMHALIASVITMIGWAIGFTIIGGAIAIAVFYGKEVGEHWYKYKGDYPAGSIKHSINSWLFIKWDKGSQFDWLAAAVPAAVLALILNKVGG